MITVIFYNLILFSSTFFVWASEKGKGSLEKYFFLGVAFLLVFIPAAIRYDIGTDYINYLEIYRSGGFINYQITEPGFYYINWFLKNIGAHFQWLFAVFAFIFTAVTFKAYPRNQAWLLHLLFFSILWFFSFNGVRQAIASSWCLLALFAFFDRRYIWFFVLIIIGATFHQSALFIAAAGIAALTPLSNLIKTRTVSYILISFIVFTFVSMGVVLTYIEQILNLVGFTKYAAYFSSTKHFITRDFGSGLGVLAKVLFSIYIIWNAKAFMQINKNYSLLIILVFAYAVGVVLANSIIIFGRMSHTFIIAPIVAGYLMYQLPNNRQLNRFVLICFVVFLMLTFFKESFGVPTSYGDPKRMPYQTIFSSEEI